MTPYRENAEPKDAQELREAKEQLRRMLPAMKAELDVIKSGTSEFVRIERYKLIGLIEAVYSMSNSVLKL